MVFHKSSLLYFIFQLSYMAIYTLHFIFDSYFQFSSFSIFLKNKIVKLFLEKEERRGSEEENHQCESKASMTGYVQNISLLGIKPTTWACGLMGITLPTLLSHMSQGSFFTIIRPFFTHFIPSKVQMRNSTC